MTADRTRLSHGEMVARQVQGHRSIRVGSYPTIEKYVTALSHRFTYASATALAHGLRVLDLGCNTGYGSQMLAFVARSVTGCDVSERAIAEARMLRVPKPIAFGVADAADLPYDDDAFDLVVCSQVIEHIVDRGRVYAQVRRVLAAGGVAVFATPNACIRLDPGMMPWNRFHVTEFTPDALQEELQQHFSAVELLGVRADPEIEAVARERVDRRRRARRAGTQTPPPVERPAPDELLSFQRRHKLASFHCVATALDESLCQIAICGEDTVACRDAAKLLAQGA